MRASTNPAASAAWSRVGISGLNQTPRAVRNRNRGRRHPKVKQVGAALLQCASEFGPNVERQEGVEVEFSGHAEQQCLLQIPLRAEVDMRVDKTRKQRAVRAFENLDAVVSDDGGLRGSSRNKMPGSRRSSRAQAPGRLLTGRRCQAEDEGSARRSCTGCPPSAQPSRNPPRE